MSAPFKVSIIAPMFNEASVIGLFIERTIGVLREHYQHYELLLIDDGSTDDTLLISRQYVKKYPQLRIIAFSRNYGREIAMTAGLQATTGDYVIIMDSDCQNPPEFIPPLVNKAQEGYDVVYAQRTKRLGETWLKKLTSHMFYVVARRMTGFDLPMDAGDFRVMTRKVVDAINQLKEHHRYLMMLYAYVGYKTTSIPYEVAPRAAGKTKYNYVNMINLALDAIISFSNKPLRYMSLLSIIISFLMGGYTGFVVLEKLFGHGHYVAGWPTIICVMSLLFSILFLFLAVISEYIGRILVEAKNRPLYYVREEIRADQPPTH